MRQLIRTYTITGQHEITITGYTFTKEDVRLIIDESIAITDKRASVLVSSTAKNNIVSIVNGVITLASTTAPLTVGDELTIEIDIDNVAKEETSQSILTAVENINVESADLLAQFFGVTLLEGYEFMTDTEVCGELEDIMQVIDPNLTAEQAAAITAQTLNPSES